MPRRAATAKRVIQNAAPGQTDPEVAVTKARRFIELPGVLGGQHSGPDPCGLPWLPPTRFLTRVLSRFSTQTLSPICFIERCTILAKPRCNVGKSWFHHG